MREIKKGERSREAERESDEDRGDRLQQYGREKTASSHGDKQRTVATSEWDDRVTSR